MSGSPTPARLAARVTQVEQHVARQLAELSDKIQLAALGDFRDVRLARTATKPSGSYPSSGNTFWIEFLDSYFTDASGSQTPTHASRGIAEGAHAHNVAGGYVASGTVVIALWQRGLNAETDGEWWFYHADAAGAVEWDQITDAGDSTLALTDVSDLVGGSLDSDGDGIVTYTPGTGTATIVADGTYELMANVETEFAVGTLAGQIAGQVKISFKVVTTGTTRYTIGHNSHTSGIGISRYTATGSVILVLSANDTINIEANVLGNASASTMPGSADLNQWTIKKLA